MIGTVSSGGAVASADGPQHPLPGGDVQAATEQLGAPGPWYARLPHFRLEFTPSAGRELQSEFFVRRADGPAAVGAIADLGPALAPLLVIWFGLGITSKILVAWSIVFFIMFYNVYAGVKSIDPDYIKAIRLLGATPRQITRIVVAPAIVSWVFAALRICVSYALLGAVVGEFAGATSGLGYRLIVAEGLLQTDLLYAIIFILMTIGYLVSVLTKYVELWFLRWRPPVAAI